MKAHVLTMVVAGLCLVWPNEISVPYGWFLIVWGIVGAIIVIANPRKEPTNG